MCPSRQRLDPAEAGFLTRGLRRSWPALAGIALACSPQPKTQSAPQTAAASTKAVAAEPTPVPAAAQANEPKKPVLIPGAQPIAPFVAEQLMLEPNAPTLVYVGAPWCEPCRRFHDALKSGELDQALPGLRFIEYDFDTNKDALAAEGYSSRMVPLFAIPKPDGRASGRNINGSIKGEGAVGNILPRLQALLASK